MGAFSRTCSTSPLSSTRSASLAAHIKPSTTSKISFWPMRMDRIGCTVKLPRSRPCGLVICWPSNCNALSANSPVRQFTCNFSVSGLRSAIRKPRFSPTTSITFARSIAGGKCTATQCLFWEPSISFLMSWSRIPLGNCWSKCSRISSA